MGCPRIVVEGPRHVDKDLPKDREVPLTKVLASYPGFDSSVVRLISYIVSHESLSWGEVALT